MGRYFSILFLVFTYLHCFSEEDKKMLIEKDGGFAVVEIFVSQGCSNCPPAEDFAAFLVEKANAKDLPIYVITYHVDYWDSLGWKDVHSAYWATKYQEEYAHAMNIPKLYTPQMIINGKHQFIATKKDKAYTLIEEEMNKSGNNLLELIKKKVDNNRILMNVKYEEKVENMLLKLVLIDGKTQTEVKSGENAGKLLINQNPALLMEQAKLSGGTFDINVILPPGFHSKEAQVVAYIQDPKTFEILDAEIIKVWE